VQVNKYGRGKRSVQRQRKWEWRLKGLSVEFGQFRLKMARADEIRLFMKSATTGLAIFLEIPESPSRQRVKNGGQETNQRKEYP